MTAAACLDVPAARALPRSLGSWLARLRTVEIPVLRDTADLLEAYRAHEDDVDANRLGEWVAGDPLMTLKVLAHESAHRSRRVVTPADTVTAAIVMLGITPFFRAFGPQPAVEDRLGPIPGAQAGFDAVRSRAARGADFALAFAVHRADPHAATIHAAALLHEFAELLIWCEAPVQALEIAHRQAADPALRSHVAQAEVLGIDLETLQRTLIDAWRLPPLLDDVTASRDQPASHGAARTVALATRLARHLAHGWDDPAVPDDLAEIAAFLNLSPAATESLLRAV